MINKKKAVDNESLQTYVDEVKKLHPKFKCLHEFNDINLGKRRIITKGQEMCFYVKDYCLKNNISIIGLFQRPESVRFSSDFKQTSISQAFFKTFKFRFKERVTVISPGELKSGLRVKIFDMQVFLKST